MARGMQADVRLKQAHEEIRKARVVLLYVRTARMDASGIPTSAAHGSLQLTRVLSGGTRDADKPEGCGTQDRHLSKGSPEMLAAALVHGKIAHLFDAMLSVDEVGVYMPQPQVYQLAVERLGVKPEAISFQSSKGWDAFAASAFGMRVVWCNRYDQPPEHLPGRPEAEIDSLAKLPALVGA